MCKVLLHCVDIFIQTKGRVVQIIMNKKEDNAD